MAEAEDKLGGVELKLAEVVSLNLAQADEIVDLKAALKHAKISGTTRALRMLRTPWSLLSTKPGLMGSRRGGW